ncbi:MAG: LytTR family DNA-binding domain-containing protein [Lentimicrobiaceae bacterium]|jgi:two-component system LytT family response regulator|nr:LytTR family DNA-binding domain-containing protein [Lentimicrobiaceae bacterium]
MIRAIIVEDELPSQKALINYLEEFCPDVEIEATATNVKQGISVISKCHPELIFLDITLPDGLGFDILKKLNYNDYFVICLTAYEEFAMESYKYQIFDYLMKPIEVDELVNAVNNVQKKINKIKYYNNLDEVIKYNGYQMNYLNKLLVSTGQKIRIIDFDEIIYCMADKYCTLFFLIKNGKIISSKNLKQFEIKLTYNFFMRVHHSYIVNLKYVIGLTKDNTIEMKEQHNIPLGEKYRKLFLERLK